MQGTARMDRELFDAAEIVGDLVPPGSVFAFLAQHRSELFDDEFIADLFPSKTGRPSLPADLVGSVLVLKELYGLSDPQTAEALKFDIRWKVACGRSLTQMSFDPSTLVYWRRRIAASDRPHRVFDKIAEVVAATGILRGRRKRCVDSTVFDDAVATQDTVTQVVAAMRRVARVVPGATDVIAKVCTLDYSKPGKPDIDWDDPAAKQRLVSDLVNDASAVLAVLTGPDAPERDTAEADALGLLALVAGQDVEPAEGSDGTDGRWRIARRVAPDRVISTVDPQARHTRKSRSQRRDGYRGHLAAEPETGLITDCEMTMATGEANTDAAVGVKMAHRDRFSESVTEDTTEDSDAAGQADTAAHTASTADTTDVDAATQAETTRENTTTTTSAAAGITDPADTARPTPDDTAAQAGTGQSATGHDSPQARPEQDTARGGLQFYGDSAYGTGDARAAYRAAGHDVVIKPKPLPQAVPGGFTLDDFIIDENEGTLTCPAGNTRPMSPSRTVNFGRLCADCPLRQRCTTSKTGRSMTIHEHEDLLRAARAQAKTPQFKRDYPTRSNVERTVAQVATQNGRRVKLRHIGTVANDAWLHTRCAALNLRTLVKHGLTRVNGSWAIA
jgi:transposase